MAVILHALNNPHAWIPAFFASVLLLGLILDCLPSGKTMNQAKALQVRIEKLQAEQDNILETIAKQTMQNIQNCQTINDLTETEKEIKNFPRGFFRSELLTAWNQKKSALGC